MKNCRLCDLYKTRTHILKGEGDPKADIMLIAQAPGDQEDRENRMFIGPSGKILDMLLEKAGISRKKIYMTNLLKCMLPKNRRPKLREIEACSVYLRQEIERVRPYIIAPLGYYPTKYMFETYGPGRFTKEEYPQKIGILCPAGDFFLFPITHPTTMIHYEEFIPRGIENFRRLKNYAQKRV
ncbi:MAG: uracil-DNA glycosylase [Candidatus Syntrophosphaera sp.]